MFGRSMFDTERKGVAGRANKHVLIHRLALHFAQIRWRENLASTTAPSVENFTGLELLTVDFESELH